MKSVMSHQFSQVPKAQIERSSFDRSHGYKTTFDAGYLIPFLVDEALPGDTFNVKMTAFARLATPIKPIMDNMYLDTFFFAVPYRLVWDNWQKFNGEQVSPGDSTDYLIPQIVAPTGGFLYGSLYDYMGVPTGVEGLSISALPLRAFTLIFDEWFRDQNLEGPYICPKGDGPDAPTLYTPVRRGKRHDYFTSCLPWPQKGPDVLVPLGAQAPIRGLGLGTPYTFNAAPDPGVIHESGFNSSTDYDATGYAAVNAATSPWLAQQDPSNPGYPLIYADLAAATSAKINQLREAFQLQRLFERDARGGTRYKEIIKAHFNVDSPDFRLQRPEYLGGGSTPINIHPVAQTSGTGAYTDTPAGDLTAYGTVSSHGHGFSKSFTEHCIIIGIMNVRADLTYQQGLNRMWSRQTRYDFFWPALSHIGEQAVLNKEIYAVGSAGITDDGVFGYQERYAEYRYFPSQITGKFRSTDPTSLDVWHLSQDFGSLPVLNSQFIRDTPPIARVVAVTTEPHFLFDSYIKMTCARPMSVYGVPGMIDHF